MIKSIAIYYKFTGFHSKENRDGKSRGVLLLYISNSINYKRRPDLEVRDNNESVWTEITYQNSKPMLVCTAYRPPSAP